MKFNAIFRIVDRIKSCICRVLLKINEGLLRLSLTNLFCICLCLSRTLYDLLPSVIQGLKQCVQTIKLSSRNQEASFSKAASQSVSFLLICVLGISFIFEGLWWTLISLYYDGPTLLLHSRRNVREPPVYVTHIRPCTNWFFFFSTQQTFYFLAGRKNENLIQTSALCSALSLCRCIHAYLNINLS
jgi:hypothetical protein